MLRSGQIRCTRRASTNGRRWTFWGGDAKWMWRDGTWRRWKKTRNTQILLTIAEPCLNPEFPQEQPKITMLGKYEYLFQEMCGTIMWIGKQNDSAALQSIYSMNWRPSLQRRRRNEICWRIVKSMLSNCSEMLIILGTYWTTRYSKVSEQTCTITKWTKACDKRLNRLISYKRQFSLTGQNFSWLEQVGHELEQRAGNLSNAVRRICVKTECRWLCKPIKGQSKTTKTYFCQLIHKNYTYWWKNLDWSWTRKTFALRLSSVEEIDPSSSSWMPTSRQWSSDWILENKR